MHRTAPIIELTTNDNDFRLSTYHDTILSDPLLTPTALPRYLRPPLQSSSETRRVNLSPRVLIVDRSRESREVLRTLLERRGATTIEADRPEQAVQLADSLRPDLIVLDAESDHSATRRRRPTIFAKRPAAPTRQSLFSANCGSSAGNSRPVKLWPSPTTTGR